MSTSTVMFCRHAETGTPGLQVQVGARLLHLPLTREQLADLSRQALQLGWELDP